MPAPVWLPRMRIRMRRCWIRRSIRWCCNGWPGRRTWPATCSPCCAIVPNSPSATTQLRMLDSSGRLVDARVTWIRTIVPGPLPRCGYFAQPDKPARMILDGPLLPADWTVELNYLANSDGSMTLSLSQGPAARFRCIRGSTGYSRGCRAPATRSRCGPTPRRCRCASRRGPWVSSRRHEYPDSSSLSTGLRWQPTQAC